MRLYLDSAVIIYHIERTMPFATAVDARLASPGVVLISSELARMECLVVPLRQGNANLVTEFDVFFNARLADRVEFTAAVFRRAAEIRAQHNFKTPDALHLAAAIEGACDAILTNDQQLTRFTGIAVEVI